MQPPSSFTPLKKDVKYAFLKLTFYDTFFPKFGSILSILKGKVKDSYRRNIKKSFCSISEWLEEIDRRISQSIDDKSVNKLADDSLQLWNKTQKEMTALEQVPQRVEYINSTYIELLRISKSVLETSKMKSKTPDLYKVLFDTFSTIVDSYISVFVMLLEPRDIDESLTSDAIQKTQALLNELPVKYTPFCYPESKEEKTEFYFYVEKHLQKIINRTKRIVEIGNDPFSLNPIIKEIDSLFAKMYATAGFFKTTKNSKPGTYSGTRPEPTVDYFGHLVRTTINELDTTYDKNTKPWFEEPMYFDMKKISDDMKELSCMAAARQNINMASLIKKPEQFADSQVEMYKAEIPSYGLKDVYDETIASVKWRTACVNSSSESLSDYSSRLEGELKYLDIKEDYLENLLSILTKENKRLEEEKNKTQGDLNKTFEGILQEKLDYLGLIENEKDKMDEIDEELREIAAKIKKLREEKEAKLNEQKVICEEIKQIMEINNSLEEKRKASVEKINEIEANDIATKKCIGETQVKDEALQEKYMEQINELDDALSKLNKPLKDLLAEKKKLEAEIRELKDEKIPGLSEEYDILVNDLNAYQINIKNAKMSSDATLLNIIKAKLESL